MKKFLKYVTKTLGYFLILSAVVMLFLGNYANWKQMCDIHRLEIYESTISYATDCFVIVMIGTIIEYFIEEVLFKRQYKWIGRTIMVLLTIPLIVFYPFIKGAYKNISYDYLIPRLVVFLVIYVIAIMLVYYIIDKRNKIDIVNINSKLIQINEEEDKNSE